MNHWFGGSAIINLDASSDARSLNLSIMADLRSLLENPPHDAQGLETFRERISQIMSDIIAQGDEHQSSNPLSLDQRRQLVSDLPRLTAEQVRGLGHHDSSCPICFTPFAAIFAEEETALAMDSSVEGLGVTKLTTSECDHLFCRKDISKWINSGHGSCPMCRRSLGPSQDTELINQVRDFMGEMHRNGAVAYVDRDGDFRGFGEPLYTPDGYDEDDRSEFSGMYS
ncbi:hypothetical protein DFH09DRAFT_24981 [Mycena vulgaris]|nr:hypothetical protein DFH09DRAFT_24981 [Mycena vulgaris]